MMITKNKKNKLILAITIKDYVVCEFLTHGVCVLDRLFSLTLRILTLNFIKKKRTYSLCKMDIMCSHYGGVVPIFVTIPLVLILCRLTTRYIPYIGEEFAFCIYAALYYFFLFRHVDTDRYFPVFERGFRNRLPKWRLYVFAALVINWTLLYLYCYLTDL